MSPEVISDLAMLERLVPPEDKDVVDVGCGGGALVRALTDLGARVTGVEISESQLATAIEQDDGRGARYLVGRAEQLPLGDSSVDLAVFMRSFHHVPAGDLDAALAEARRVIRPGGAVYVAEPLAEGNFFELTRLVDDETEVRAAAQAALARAPDAGLRRANTVDYDAPLTVAGVPGLRARIVAADPRRAARFDELSAELAEGIERLGAPGERPGERRFLHPMRADVLRPALS
jgi:SAM-dependent methyltransferase